MSTYCFSYCAKLEKYNCQVFAALTEIAVLYVADVFSNS